MSKIQLLPLYLGDALAETLKARESPTKPYEIEVLKRAFFDALIKAAKKNERHIIEEVRDNKEMARSYLAKALPLIQKRWKFIKEFAPAEARKVAA